MFLKTVIDNFLVVDKQKFIDDKTSGVWLIKLSTKNGEK